MLVKIAALAALTAVGIATGSALLAPEANAAPLKPTVTGIVRPVHANGTPVAGYKVRTEKIDGFTCNEPATVSVSNGVAFCGFSYTYTVACWKSTSHTVLCLRNVHSKALVRIHYYGSFPSAKAPKHPTPMAMTLVGGNSCVIRDGGAWDYVPTHKDWFGTYSCTTGNLYGPTKNNGIIASTSPWTVHLVTGFTGNHTQKIHEARVAHAYYVGTAA